MCMKGDLKCELCSTAVRLYSQEIRADSLSGSSPLSLFLQLRKGHAVCNLNVKRTFVKIFCILVGLRMTIYISSTSEKPHIAT